MVTLEKGCFYAEPEGEIYYYDGNSLYCLGTTNRLTPTTCPHNGFSSIFHDMDVDIRKFQKVEPLEYIKAKTNLLNELVLFIQEHKGL